ncbi:hypothetical protein ACIQFU_06755 [Streptomyces sp. NPDC093065]|uniref:hypothetical protein n=1 Tax=Streptomyces sp. NPDC093065 TaxID=3366021 RepID=UPI0038161FA9
MTTRSGDRTEPAHIVRDAYEAPAAVVRPLGEEESWLLTGCTGWAVRDLMFPFLAAARRALVALHTPAAAPPDRDAVTYWRDWAPDPVGAAHGRRHNLPRACSSNSCSSRTRAWRPWPPPPRGPRARPRRTAR